MLSIMKLFLIVSYLITKILLDFYLPLLRNRELETWLKSDILVSHILETLSLSKETLSEAVFVSER